MRLTNCKTAIKVLTGRVWGGLWEKQRNLQGRISLYLFFSRFSGAFPTRQLSEGFKCSKAW